MPFHYSYGQWLPVPRLNQNENSDDSYIWSIPIMVIVHWLYFGGLLEVILARVKNSLIKPNMADT